METAILLGMLAIGFELAAIVYNLARIAREIEQRNRWEGMSNLPPDLAGSSGFHPFRLKKK